MHRLAGLLLLSLVGCGESTLTRPQALTRLKTQAEVFGRTILREDYDKMVELMPPALVEQLGGREAYVRRLEAIAVERRKQGGRTGDLQVQEPSEMVESGGKLFGIVPYEVEMTLSGGMRARQPSYLIGVSGDTGATWQFLDGTGVGDDRGKLRTLLPNFPDNLELPEKQAPRLERPPGDPRMPNPHGGHP